MVCVSSTILEKQVQDFASGKMADYAFPAELTARERKTVKMAAEKLGLSSRSFGMGMQRQIYIFKANSNESPRSSDTGSTAESESQGPAVEFVSIKNSFVHFKESSKAEHVDPRIIQSMPNGKFGESLKADMIAAAGAQKENAKRKLVPLLLSNNEEAETEMCSGELFPATPTADTNCEIRDQALLVQAGQWMPSSKPAVPDCASTMVLPSAMFVPPATTMTALPPTTLIPPSPSTAVLQPSLARQGSSTTVLPPAVWTSSPQGQTNATPSPVAASLPVAPSPQHGDCRPSVTFQADAALSPTAPSQPDRHPPLAFQAQHLAQDYSPCWTPGTPVVLCGLANQPTFNGLHGVVSSFDAGCGRYNISLEVAPNKQRMVKVKAHNLLPAQPSMPLQPPGCQKGTRPPCRS